MDSLLTHQKAIAVIGLGHRSLNTAIDSICSCALFVLTAICEPNKKVLQQTQKRYPDVLCFTSAYQLLDHCNSTEEKLIDCAYVAVPHNQYALVIPSLLRNGIHVLKEKPAGVTSAELEHFQNIASAHGTRLVTASQTRHGLRWAHLSQWLPEIGVLLFVEGTRKISVSNLEEGWRARKAIAGGGVVNDLGWHLLDNVLGIIGSGLTVSVPYAKLFTTRPLQDYDCEDSAQVILEIRGANQPGDKQSIGCNLRISRIGPGKVDQIVFVGSKGTLIAHNGNVKLMDQNSLEVRSYHATNPSREDFDRMLKSFHSEIQTDSKTSSAGYQGYALQDLLVTRTLDLIYSCYGTIARVNETHPDPEDFSALGRSMQWPRISKDVEKAILAQLHQEISIYGSGGVLLDFENEFKQVHQQPDWHALLHNSGTNALQALYYAAGFMPGDEVSYA